MQRSRGKQYEGKYNFFCKRIGDTKGAFHTKMGTIKDRNGKDLTVAEEIKKRWQKYTDITKVLMTQIIMMVWPLT